ncbi:MAG: ATP synthase F1 subunit gamma [Bacteroidaceae bacterium]|nr:ATP synthase F1 subunit gamma [Bacteroidaceae bacterium]MBP5522778.1 ATP synthase F1 subunit gamma [Bacteroidaceae bacterium]
MGSLKEIKARIASVHSTQKTTSAMRMVASAKLRRTQTLTQNFQRYSSALRSITDQLGTTNSEQLSGDSIVLIPISSSSGLCGAFNSNIAKATIAQLETYNKEGKRVIVMPIGKKITKEIGKLKDQPIDTTYSTMNELVGKDGVYSEIQSFIALLQQMYREGKIQKAEIIYHHFISTGKQAIETKVLPLNPPTIVNSKDTESLNSKDFITEPSPQELINILHPRMLNAEMYSILLDAASSEHAARMMAMQTADDNANELLQELTLQYNKTRQQSITNELIDMMGGKVNS